MSHQRESSTKETGLITEIIYHNADNGYTVCVVDTSEEEIVVVGSLPMLSVGEKATFTGKWAFHQTHGPQFKADYYETIMPKTCADILRYLSSGVIKGIRAVTAKKIVDKFGDETLNILAGEPLRLAEIKGISEKKAKEIGDCYASQIGVRDVVIFLQRYSISPHVAYTIYKKYGLSSIPVIKHNPYILAEEVHGIGFKTADSIALGMGYDPSSSFRITAGVKYALGEASLNGHTNLPKDILVPEAATLLGLKGEIIDANISRLSMQGDLVVERVGRTDYLYLPIFYNSEQSCARLLSKMIKFCYEPMKEKTINKLIAKSEKARGFLLAPRQKEAVMMAATNGVSVVTGGPGTGKTTIIKTIISIMEDLDMTITLAAPTGRAAKRMTEMCENQAVTIHRLLEYNRESNGTQRFMRDENNPIHGDVIIIDEMSMVDTLIFNALLKAIKPGTRLILVGDADQLPSVGAGNVLNDIISSCCLPVAKLDTIYRQQGDSTIIINAHRINKGEYPIIDNNSSDFFFMGRESAEEITETIKSLCLTRLPSKYGYDPLIDIQVLTPMRRSGVGVNVFNEELQQVLNPKKPGQAEIYVGHNCFRVGDKVMQTKNNYDMAWTFIDAPDSPGSGVFNGDIGYITKISVLDGEITVLYDGEKVTVYNMESAQELELAYAMTIHKSQGSEFKAIIIPMFQSAPMLQNRNLLYTAVTRAREMVILVGKEYIIRTMVDNISEQKRYSGLKRRIEDFKDLEYWSL
ncbi:MAG: ATP-dependent RecD-like DNA helicase [Eubacteriales bacterium]|nr:ATP-dependent RecD-like DNA helicase [Eubacteriales bacterium]